MSNALAIAAVTRILKDLLNDALVNGDVSSSLGTAVTVTALPPDRVLDANGGGTEETQLNLFLHQVTANAAWRNADLPTRDGRGRLVDTPLLPLNLHYLLTAYAADELHAEILLGYAMQLLHENALLSREAIRTALAGGAVDNSMLPPAFQGAAASELADQVELIKITPEALSTDDMSKLWTAMQTHYRTTVAYQISVVLIESRVPSRTPLPVLTRGAPDPSTGGDAGVAVQPGLLPPFPALDAVVPRDEQIAARMGEPVTLTGHHLLGDQVSIRCTHPRTHRVLVLPALDDPTPRQVRMALPPDPPDGPVGPDDPTNPANWLAGAYGVTVSVERAGEPLRETNELPLLLAPDIAVSAAQTGADTTFTVSVRPPVHDTQRVSLIVGNRELPAPALAPGPNTTVSFTGRGFAAASTQPVRLRVDGVDSILIDRAARPPRFDPSQVVTIP